MEGLGRFTEVLSQFRPFLLNNSNFGVLEGRIVSLRSQWKGSCRFTEVLAQFRPFLLINSGELVEFI